MLETHGKNLRRIDGKTNAEILTQNGRVRNKRATVKKIRREMIGGVLTTRRRNAYNRRRKTGKQSEDREIRLTQNQKKKRT